MNLIIDIGNTLTKVAVIKDDSIISTEKVDELGINEVWDTIQKSPTINKAIISSVKDHNESLVSFIGKQINLLITLNSQTPLPLEILYKSKDTLGNDRIAAAIGANNIYPSQNVLIIDAGSAITIDFVNDQNQYVGGIISPGMQMRFQALNQYTAHLPLLSTSDTEVLEGKTTHEAITSGVQNGIIFEVEGYIARYLEKYPDLKVVITGGDAFFFDKKLKNSIFVNLNLVTIGLNRILEYNAKKK